LIIIILSYNNVISQIYQFPADTAATVLTVLLRTLIAACCARHNISWHTHWLIYDFRSATASVSMRDRRQFPFLHLFQFAVVIFNAKHATLLMLACRRCISPIHNC